MILQERDYSQTSKKILQKHKIDDEKEGYRAMAERAYKKLVNYFQTKEFRIGLDATVGLEYDLTNPADYKMWVTRKD